MSKLSYQKPIDVSTGKIEHESNVSTRVLYGTKHSYFWHEDNVVAPTPERVLHQFALKLANIRTAEIMKHPSQLQLTYPNISFPGTSKAEMRRLPAWRFRHLLLGHILRDIKDKAHAHDADTIHALMDLANDKAHKDLTLSPNNHSNSPKAQLLATFLQPSE